MDHHTGHTTYGASSHGELGAMADAITRLAATLLAYLPHIVRVWFVVMHMWPCAHMQVPF